jgi:hypothetical protein
MPSLPYLIFFITFLAGSHNALATRGTRGGPNYRGPNGKCVGCQEIGRVCGAPPNSRCTAENVAASSTDGAELGKKLDTI